MNEMWESCSRKGNWVDPNREIVCEEVQNARFLEAPYK